MRFKELQILLVSIIFIFSCGDSDFSGITEGQLLTQSGAPVSDAEIHINYPKLSDNSMNKSSTTINFPLQNSTYLTFEISRYGSEEFILGFVDRPYLAGSHSLVIPDSLLTTGVYHYKIDSEEFSSETNFLKLKSDSDLINNSPPFTMTNKSGRFIIETNTIGIGVEFEQTGSSPDEKINYSIDNEIEFIAIKNDEIVARKTVMISEDGSNNVELIVQN